MENTFKSSVFGGFNRDDVIRYIEKTALETKQRMDELEKEIDGLCRENANLRRDAGSAADARDRLSDSYYNLIEEQKAVKKELEQAQQETLSLQDQLSSLEEEKSSLLARIAQLQQQVDEYNTVKAHISDIEFSARQRADEHVLRHVRILILSTPAASSATLFFPLSARPAPTSPASCASWTLPSHSSPPHSTPCAPTLRSWKT